MTDTIPTPDSVTGITGFLPLTKCNDIIRRSFSGSAVPGDFAGLLAVSAVFFVIGYLAFEIFMRKAKQKGNLLMY